MKPQLFSMVMLFSFMAFLTVLMNHVSHEFFSAASAAKTVRTKVKAKTLTIPSKPASPSPSTAVEISTDPSDNCSSVSQEKETRMTATPTSIERHLTPFASVGAKLHAHMSTNTTGIEGMLCKMCETDAECTESKQTCKKRRCVTNDNELILCLRNTHWECGDCHSNNDCHKGLCRAGICAENIHRFHKCQSMISFYRSISNETLYENKERDVDETEKEDVVRETVAETRKEDNVADVATDEKTEARKDRKEKTTLTVNKNFKKKKSHLGNAIKAEGHANGGHGVGLAPSRNVNGPVGDGSDGSSRIEHGKDDAKWNVQGMAVGFKDKQRIQVDERCSGSTTRSDSGETCKQKQVNCKRTTKTAKAEKAKKANKKLRRATKVKAHLSDAHVASTNDAAAASHDEDVVTTHRSGHRYKTMNPTPMETPGTENNYIADEDGKHEDGNDTDDENNDISDEDVHDNNDDDDDPASDDSYEEDDGQFYASLDWEKLSKSLSPEQWREVMRTYGIQKLASKNKDERTTHKGETIR